MLPTRKSIRLPRECYRGGDPFLLTVCTSGKTTTLTREPVLPILLNVMKTQVVSAGGPVHAYVIMPDHLHVLLATNGDVLRWVAWFKARVTFFARKAGVEAAVWQKSFHDHGIRKAERIEDVLAYMRDNPVSAGLVERAEEWSWKYGC